MKKLSLKAKKTIIYVVTVALIVALISGVILSLGVVRAGASDLEDDVSLVVNSAQELSFTPIAGTTVVTGTDVGVVQQCMQFDGNDLQIGNTRPVLMALTNITITQALDSVPIYFTFIIECDSTDWYYTTVNFNDSTGTYGSTMRAYLTHGYCILTYYYKWSAQTLNYITFTSGADLNVIACYVGFNQLMIARNAVDRVDFENSGSSSPSSVVYGTDEFTTYDYSDTQYMLYANLSPVWDPFYAGFVGRVATADGTSVPVMYTWTIDGLNATSGNVVVLDPAYHDYVTQLSLQSHVSNGSLELLIDKSMDVRYIAVSDDLNLLSADLVDKANKLQLIQNEINAAYNDGYLTGFELGSKQALAGVFGNAQMNVALYVYDPVTGEESPLIYYLPLNVANGGMDLSSIWKLWSDSALNDGNHTLSWIQVTISFDNGVLWSNDLLYFKFNTPVTANQLPYDAYLLTVENSSQNYNVSFVERNGLWYWQTSVSLDGYSVSDISFKINNQHISYYNFLEGYNTTLNNNIQTFGTNQASYDRGYDDGYVDGVDDGYADGLDESSLTSWNEGHAAGFDEGRDVGYYAGYDDGLQDDFRFYDLFFSLFDAELNIWKSIVSFEIFGINVAGFVLGLVTIGVVAFVIRKVW